MRLRNLFKYLLLTVFIFHNATQNAVGMKTGKNDTQEDKLLVIGCRPWDENLQGFSGLTTAHFVDFMNMGAPSIMPLNFYHYDINDKQIHSSEKFSDFAENNVGKYKTIIFDWATYQHVHRDSAWSDFAKLLSANGSLIIPVMFASFKKGPVSLKKANKLIKKENLNHLFNQVNILSYDEIPESPYFDLLRRPNLEPGRLDAYIAMKPAIILAKKQSDTLEDIKSEDITPTPRTAKEKETETEDKYKEIEFPRIAKIKEGLIEGRSTLFSEIGDGFSVQSILGSFFGLRPEAIEKGFDLELKYVGNSIDKKGTYSLIGVLHLITADSKLPPIPLFLKSLDGQTRPYKISGGTETAMPTHYKVSDLEQLKILIEKDLQRPSTHFETRTITSSDQKALAGLPGNEAPHTSTNVIKIKTTPESGRLYQERTEKEKYAASRAYCLRALAKINEERGEKDFAEPFFNAIRRTPHIAGHGEHIKLLQDNLERNKSVIEWIDAESRWPKETNTHDFWSLQAIKDAYMTADEYVKIATNLRRSSYYAQADNVASKGINESMRDVIEEWLSPELMEKFVKKGFAWH